IKVYDKQGLVAQAPISSGRRGLDTPKGIFTILQKNKRHFSNLYAGAPMPNMQRITWSGVAMHGGPLPGYPASHGCVRLPYSFAKTLFGITEMHGRVIVADDPVLPEKFQHARLFQPLPGGDSNMPSHAGHQRDGTVAVAEAKPSNRIDSDLGAVIGVRPANAATTVARVEDSNRSERANRFRRKRLAKQAQIADELAASKEAFELYHIDAKRTVVELKEAQAALAKGKAAVAARKKDAKKADADAAAAHRKLKDFDRKYRNVSRRQTADKLAKLAELERALDDRALRLSDEAEAAHKAVFAAQRRISGLQSSVTLVKQTVKTAKAKLVPVKKRLVAAKAAEEKFKESEKQRAKPISIFISGKTGRLYARQGWYEIIDVPVSIKDPNVALGTHLFTAIDAAQNGPGLEWNVVSLESGRTAQKSRRQTRYSKYYGKKSNLRPIQSRVHPATLALDRIDIPQDTRDQIEDLMKPGSSLIVSDYPKSNETGKHTDFIVLTR
ncbi:MAG: L,D-transpeptidase family protein, partial [Alphaproteobacteria bacterium]|nr:L,D-transpeptidase family protein [Alphaproteobacteria bacterium]